MLEEVGNETGVRYEQSLRDDLPGAPGEETIHGSLMQYNFATMIEARRWRSNARG